VSQFTMSDLGLGKSAGFLDTISRPDVMDQALLYMAPWHWKQKKREEAKSFKRQQQALREQRYAEQAKRFQANQAKRREQDEAKRARREVRSVQRKISSMSASVNEAAGEVARLTAQYSLSFRFRSEAEQIVAAAMSLSLEAPSPERGMPSPILRDLVLELERVLGIMQQLAVRAEGLLRTARAYRR
jgi:serine/threonine-protein kinase RIO1